MTAQPLRPAGQPLHPLRCAVCSRTFTSRRSDATFCSVRCRVASWRRSQRDSTAPAKSDAPPTAETPRTRGITADTDELEDGWRRVPGGRVIPPAEPRNSFFVDQNDLRRL